jgi:hypothetical protein
MGQTTIKPRFEQHPYHTFSGMVKAVLYGGGHPIADKMGIARVATPSATHSETKPEREDILLYIDRIRHLMTDSWKANYRKWWSEIIDHPTISAVIYQKGRQVDTTFNRNLVGNIINYLGQHGMIKVWKASDITIALEGKVEHSIRTSSLGKNPPADIEEILKAYVKQEKKK